ncbi:LPS translocon maturation chaperone LptM [Endozoicomonas numazuensis]|nr:lipoprotein [Endozoicomonas numazuensis]
MSSTVSSKLFALMFTTLLLAGCGQKGDLYLPTDGDAQQLTSGSLSEN